MQFHLQFETETEQQEENFADYKIVIFSGEKLDNTTPHIVLASFLLDTEREILLLKYLDKISSNLTPFRVSANDNFDETLKLLMNQINLVLKIDVRVHKKHLLKNYITHFGKNSGTEFLVEKIVLLKQNIHHEMELCKEFYFF